MSNHTALSLLAAAVVLGQAPAPTALPVAVRYREPADVFEILDNASNWWPGYCDSAYVRYWTDSVGVQAGDSALMARYARLRERYYDTRGQGNAVPRRDGSGLFTARAALDADPVGAAFYGAETWDEAFRQLRTVVTPEEVTFLQAFYAHFRARYAPLVADTRARTAASRAVTAATLGTPEVGAYLAQVRAFFGIPAADAPPFTALYVWWPRVEQTRATPQGRVLILRVRPAAGDTVNSADVVAHEAIHVYAALQPEAQQRLVSAAVLDRCPVPAGVSRLAVLEEPLATALGNIEFRRRFEPARFSWSRRWYGNEWVELSARLLYPVLTSALEAGRPLDAALGRDAGALCGLLARATAVHSPVPDHG